MNYAGYVFPLIMMLAFGGYAVWMMQKRGKMMNDMGPAMASFFQRTGWRYADMPPEPIDHHVHRVLLFIDHDRLHVGRRQRTDDKLGRILRPQDDVDALAGKLVGHGVDARAAHAHAGADRVDTLVVRLHRDLGARASVARAALDLEPIHGDAPAQGP